MNSEETPETETLLNDAEASVWEKQKLILGRQFDLADATRQMRVRVPIVTSVLNLSLVSFLVTHPEILDQGNNRFLTVAVIAMVSIFGCTILFQIHAQYRDITRRIIHLYEKMGMVGSQFFPAPLQNRFSGGSAIFVVAYGAMVFTGAICVAAILFAPDPP